MISPVLTSNMSSNSQVILFPKITLITVTAINRSTSNLVSCGVVNLNFRFKPPMLRCELTILIIANNPIPMTTSQLLTISICMQVLFMLIVLLIVVITYYCKVITQS
jgi:hypothetical protein